MIIGAMRAGTTTLYDDLCRHPRVFGAPGKEPHVLTRPDLGLNGWRNAYRRIFARSRKDQVCFEASTGYAKRPLFEGIADRARSVIGPDLRVIYLVRDPIERAISHHHYHIGDSRIDENIDRAVATWSELTDFGCYAMQIEPWLEVFGADRVLVLRFEDYIADRRASLLRVYRFLGLEVAGDIDSAPPRRNASTEAYSPRGAWRWLVKRAVIRKHVRHRLPEGLVAAVRRRWFVAPPPKPEPPSAETLDRLIETFAPEAERLAGLIGAAGPLWDLNRTKTRILDGARTEENACVR